jgi:hypothetical protein
LIDLDQDTATDVADTARAPNHLIRSHFVSLLP